MLNSAWRKVDPYRGLKTYVQRPGQVIPTQLVHVTLSASGKQFSIEERVVRIEPGYQDFSKVRHPLAHDDA